MSIVLEHGIDSLGKKRSSLFIPVTNIGDKTSCFFPWVYHHFPHELWLHFGSSQGPWTQDATIPDDFRFLWCGVYCNITGWW